MGAPGLGTWIERRARRAPGDAALIVGGAELSYLELAARIRSFAAALTARGIAAGDRVAYHGGNHPAALVSVFATAAVGAIWAPIHPARPEDEVRVILRDATPRLLIRADPETHPDAGVPELEATGLGDDGPPLPMREVEPDDVVLLPYTSGTTGPPKGVLVTEGNLWWHTAELVAALGLSAADVSVAAAPFTRAGGLGVTVLPTLFAGGAVAVPDVVDGPSVLASIERDRVSVLFANPDLLAQIVRAPGWATADLSTVRTGVVGGNLVPEPLLRTYVDRGVQLRHGYGLTEAGPAVSLLDGDEVLERVTSVGRPLPFIDVRTVRPDGSECEPGEVGEWQVRGPTVCAGYRNHPPVHDAEGWFPTGDLGSIDAEGYLSFLDRASSALHIGGATVYPATVEARLYGLPGVADAAVAEVEGRLVAAIVPEPGREPDGRALLAALAEALPLEAVPSEVRRVEEIPRNASAKVRRDVLAGILSG